MTSNVFQRSTFRVSLLFSIFLLATGSASFGAESVDALAPPSIQKDGLKFKKMGFKTVIGLKEVVCDLRVFHITPGGRKDWLSSERGKGKDCVSHRSGNTVYHVMKVRTLPRPVSVPQMSSEQLECAAKQEVALNEAYQKPENRFFIREHLHIQAVNLSVVDLGPEKFRATDVRPSYLDTEDKGNKTHTLELRAVLEKKARPGSAGFDKVCHFASASELSVEFSKWMELYVPSIAESLKSVGTPTKTNDRDPRAYPGFVKVGKPEGDQSGQSGSVKVVPLSGAAH